MTATKLTCFKAYDVRGQLGEELNTDIAYRIGRGFADYLNPKTVVVGGDIRLSSEQLKLALVDGLRDGGTNVIDLGMTGTEEIYFATSHLKTDGGIQVTASHNPMDYNGMKFVREDFILGVEGVTLELRRQEWNLVAGPFLVHRQVGGIVLDELDAKIALFHLVRITRRFSIHFGRSR